MMPSDSAWKATAQVFYDLAVHRVEIMFVGVGVLALTLQLVFILWWATGGGRENASAATPDKDIDITTEAESQPSSPDRSDAWNAKETAEKALRRRSTYSGGDRGQAEMRRTEATTSASVGPYFENLVDPSAEPVELDLDPAFENTDRMYDENHDRHTAHQDVSMSESSVLDTTAASTPAAQQQHDESDDQIDPVFENADRSYDAEHHAHSTPEDEAVSGSSNRETPAPASTPAEDGEGQDISDPAEDEHTSHSHHDHGAAKEKLRSMLDI